MNPYLELLKMKKGLPLSVPKVSKGPSDTLGTASGSRFQEIAARSDTFGTDHSEAFQKNELAECSNVHALIVEFMKGDGLSLADAQAMAAIAIPARPPSEWVAMIKELDSLIDDYCNLAKLSSETRARILKARSTQPLTSIPTAIDWFGNELGRLHKC